MSHKIILSSRKLLVSISNYIDLAELYFDLWPGRIFGTITMVSMVISVTLTIVLALNKYNGKMPCLIATCGWFLSGKYSINYVLFEFIYPC